MRSVRNEWQDPDVSLCEVVVRLVAYSHPFSCRLHGRNPPCRGDLFQVGGVGSIPLDLEHG